MFNTRNFSSWLFLLESRPKGVSPLLFCFKKFAVSGEQTVDLNLVLADDVLDCLVREGGVGNRCLGLLQAIFIDFLPFSVTSCRGSTERSPQDTDPDVPSSISAVTTETGSDEVFIISAGPGTSGLSFTTYRIQVHPPASLAGCRMSLLGSTCHTCPFLPNAHFLERQGLTQAVLLPLKLSCHQMK